MRRLSLQMIVAIVTWLLLVLALTKPEFVGEPIEKTDAARDVMLAIDEVQQSAVGRERDLVPTACIHPVRPLQTLERGAVGKGGVVRDPEERERAARGVQAAAEALGLELLAESESVLAGPKGNRERFLLLRRPA